MLLQDFNKTVSDIVRSDYRTAEVFRKYGISYCSKDKESLLEICTSRNLDYNRILRELSATTKNITIPNTLDFSEWKVDFLIEYIVHVHHAYMIAAAPALENALVSFIEEHKKFPEINKVLLLFREMSVLLNTHHRHEEEIIFPYIKQIESTHRRKEIYGNLFVRTLRKPLSNIEKEHDVIFSILKQIQALTNNYTCPENACSHQCYIYHKLEEFHNDMLQHTHLEDDILFPKAIEMEKELLQL